MDILEAPSGALRVNMRQAVHPTQGLPASMDDFSGYGDRRFQIALPKDWICTAPRGNLPVPLGRPSLDKECSAISLHTRLAHRVSERRLRKREFVLHEVPCQRT